jgi:hypothetical protein
LKSKPVKRRRRLLQRCLAHERLEQRVVLSTAQPQLLTASDFSFLGGVTLPGAYEGLTYRSRTNTFFAISHNGHDPYDLVELSLAHPKATVVKDWGPLDVGGDLSLQGSLREMKALLFVNDNELLVNAAQYYVGTFNNWALASFSLKSGKPLLDGGPWYVPAAIGANAVAGSIAVAPTALQQLGYGLVMDGTNNPVTGTGSWGLGYVGVQMPSLRLPAGSTLKAAQFVDWQPGQTTDLPFTHSDFPKFPGDDSVRIKGNEDVGAVRVGVARGGSPLTITLANDGKTFGKNAAVPLNTPVGWYVTNETTGEQLLITRWNPTTRVATTATPWLRGAPRAGTTYELFRASYQVNTYYASSNVTGPLDEMGPGVSIELLDASGKISTQGMFYIGQVALGYQWYGNPNAHNDKTRNGILDGNDLESALFAGQDVIDINTNRGQHTEERALRWYIADPSAIKAAARKVLAGTATASDLEVSYVSGGNLATLGGNVKFNEPRNGNDTGEMFFERSATNPSTGILYVLEPSGGPGGQSIVFMFKVSAPISARTAAMAVNGPAVDAALSDPAFTGTDVGNVALQVVQLVKPFGEKLIADSMLAAELLARRAAAMLEMDGISGLPKRNVPTASYSSLGGALAPRSSGDP